ncbi:hypothetical protein HNR46_002328 [Haloferula luteola]|uniref:Uncharacterized protein n=1 Tax=Haloferula luteola TaxID=595692 RepID=A0A840V160_9BACT|nr:hypothetical protein [Haloferula luteola]
MARPWFLDRAAMKLGTQKGVSACAHPFAVKTIEGRSGRSTHHRSRQRTPIILIGLARR